MSYQTIDTREWHDQYGDEPNLDSQMADECFDAVTETLAGWGFKGASTDLAEEVVAVLYRYIVKSRQAA